jgi:hypothetical protein
VSITLAAFAFAEPLGVNPSISIVDHGTPCRRKLSNQPTNQPTNQIIDLYWIVERHSNCRYRSFNSGITAPIIHESVFEFRNIFVTPTIVSSICIMKYISLEYEPIAAGLTRQIKQRSDCGQQS